MACYDSRSDLNTREGYELHHKELLSRFEHNSPLAEMLCTLCKTYIADTGNELPDSVVKWWNEHQKRDKATVDAKAVDAATRKRKAKALAKLTLSERRILGL